MLLRRFTAHIRQENWFAVVLDLVVIVVGLFLGLQIDNWWEGRQDARLEAAYIIEINEDLDLNKASLQKSIVNLEEIVTDMVFLLEQSELTTPDATVAELNRRFKSIHDMPTFMPVSRSYINLTGSGDLRLIRNRPLKNELADYYAASQLTELIQTTHELELVETFQPYVIDYFDYAAVAPTRVGSTPIPPPVYEDLIFEALATRQFRNIIIQKWNITSDLLYQHRAMLERTDKVLELLR